MSNNVLPSATPESMGISSSAVLRWVEKLNERGINMHGFCLMRHGKVVAEGSWAPFDLDTKHRMYSTSKSIVSVAVGMLLDRGMIDLDDPIARYFPEMCPDGDPEKLHPVIAMTTIRDMLRMATANTSSSYKIIHNEQKDWVRTFFEIAPSHVPGTVFTYDTSAPTVLSALVEKLSGKDVCAFLLENGFAEMGISPDMTAVRTPDGRHCWFGSGALISLHDLARFAQMCLHYGNYNGKQIVSEEYMRQACSKQIDNGAFGYGYQFWMSQKGFSCHGMGGQMAFMFPQEDMVLVTTADTQGANVHYTLIEELFYDLVLPEVYDSALPEDPEAYEMLITTCGDLKAAPESGEDYSNFGQQISGKTYKLYQGDPHVGRNLDFDTAKFDFEGGQGSLTLTKDGKELKLNFGFGYNEHQVFPGFLTEEEAKDLPKIAYGFEGVTPIAMPCLISAAWKSEKELSILCYGIGDYLGTIKIRAAFRGNMMTIVSSAFAEAFWTDLNGYVSGKLIEEA